MDPIQILLLTVAGISIWRVAGKPLLVYVIVPVLMLIVTLLALLAGFQITTEQISEKK